MTGGGIQAATGGISAASLFGDIKMSDDSADPAAPNALAPPNNDTTQLQTKPAGNPEDNAAADQARLTSDTLQPGDTVSEQLLARLAKLEKYEHKLAEVVRVYRNLNTARKAIEAVLKSHTPVQSIGEVEELEAHLSNLNMKTQYAGEQIGALTELDKNNRAKVQELEAKLADLRTADQERQRLAKELEQTTKERKVVEGQLERTNQKLKFDIVALQAAKKELSEKLKAMEQENADLRASVAQTQQADSDPEALAEQLLRLVPEASETDNNTNAGADNSALLTSAENPNLVSLRQRLVQRLGVPPGLVSAADLEAAESAREAQLQEATQLKDIMRKEMTSNEERLKVAEAQKAAEIDQLKEELQTTARRAEQQQSEIEKQQSEIQQKQSEIQQLKDEVKSKAEEHAAKQAAPPAQPAKPKTKAGADGEREGSGDSNAVSVERVREIVVAALARKLVPEPSAEQPAEQPAKPPSPKPAQQLPQQSGGAKKKGKKRRGTAANNNGTPPPPAPATTADTAADGPSADASTSSEKPDPVAEVKATRAEIDRLVALIEAIAVQNNGAASADKEKAAEAGEALTKQVTELRATIADLQQQLAHSIESGEKAQQESGIVIEELRARIAELESKLRETEALCSELRDKLAAETAESQKALGDLEQRLCDSRSKAEAAAKLREDEHAATLEKVTKALADAESQAREMPRLRKEAETAQTAAKQLESEMRECREKLDQKETELSAAQKNCASMQRSAAEADKERVHLASTLAKAQGVSLRLETQLNNTQAQLEDERKRTEGLQGAIAALDSKHVQALKTIEAQSKRNAETGRQLTETQAAVASLEEHVRAVDADLANSREQFAEKSRLLAQTAAQLQEMQYLLEKEKRTAKTAAEGAAKELAGVRDQLAEVRRAAKEQRSTDQAEVDRLKAQLGDVDQRASQASAVERLESLVAEKEAELEALRSNLSSAEEARMALQVDVDRLRDVERDFGALKEQLDRITEERKLSEQRWKRVHRDLKEEVRRLHRERQTLQQSSVPVATSSSAGASAGSSSPLLPLPSPSSQMTFAQQPQGLAMSAPGGALANTSLPSSRSNSLTLASVSSLLRAATGNAAASSSSSAAAAAATNGTGSGFASGRRASVQPSASSPSSLLGRPNRAPHKLNKELFLDDNNLSQQQQQQQQQSLSAAQASEQAFGIVHTRTSSNAGSSSDGLSLDDMGRNNEAVNVEYLRNVLFRFFNDKDRRAQLVPVLSMLLNCKIEDIKHIQLMLQ
ncbi:hypothetical protein GGI07_002472 [Coemansia sp. Benny D115]|nr:hypothetical protein GGI07_002472 [Coemansia sp. Benny D115]